MKKKTLTRSDIVDLIYNEVGLSRAESSQILESLIKEISSSLIKGENVKISSFGTFSSRKKEERIGRNPRTGKQAIISERRVLTFKASQILKDKVNYP